MHSIIIFSNISSSELTIFITQHNRIATECAENFVPFKAPSPFNPDHNEITARRQYAR